MPEIGDLCLQPVLHDLNAALQLVHLRLQHRVLRHDAVLSLAQARAKRVVEHLEASLRFC